MTSKERLPLLYKSNPDKGKRIAWKNLSVLNLLIFMLTIADSMHNLCLHQYIYTRITTDLVGENKTRRQNHPCHENKSLEHPLLQEAQSQASLKLLQFTLASSLPAVVVNLLIGTYSDYLGRRMLFIAPIVGLLCRCAGETLVVKLTLNLDWMFPGVVVYALCGNYFSLVMALNAYNADNTPASKNRTSCLVLTSMVASVGILVGEMGSGYFIEAAGYFYPFLTVTLILLGALVFVVLLLKESCPRTYSNFRDLPSLKDGIRRVFGFYFLKSLPAEPCDVASPAEASRDRRLEFCLGMCAFILFITPYDSASIITTLYVMNTPFCWDPSRIGTFGAIKDVGSKMICVMVFICMSRVVREDVLGLAGLLSMMAGLLVMAFADEDWMVYVASVMAMFSSLGISVIKSLMSQRAPADRQGALFASQAITEPLCMAVGGAVFNAVYSATVGHYNGLAFVSMAAAVALALIFMGAYMLVMERNKRLTHRYALADTYVHCT